ncbi:MAG TPA: monovalent cation/H+ antiporter complex subunit F [Sandaracinaceae bacterium]
MNDVLFIVLIGWHALLALALAVRAAYARALVTRAIALDTLALVVVTSLALVAVERGRADYLDVALVLALLGFAQTIATARFVPGGAREDDRAEERDG